MNYCGLIIDPRYASELEEHNKSYVCLVIRKRNHEVLATAVVTRNSLPRWYDAKRQEFGITECEYVVGAISIMGVIESIIRDSDEKERDKHNYN